MWYHDSGKQIFRVAISEQVAVGGKIWAGCYFGGTSLGLFRAQGLGLKISISEL